VNGPVSVSADRTTNGDAPGDRRPPLPQPRGPLGEELFAYLRAGGRGSVHPPVANDGGGVFGEDFQLSLYALYELHYRGFRGIAETLEWDPGLIGARAALEADFEARLHEEIPPLERPLEPLRLAEAITELIESEDGPQLSAHMETSATLDQFRELLIHRSAYQLKEADPHSWAIPRLAGPAKAALVEVQADEYGGAGRSGFTPPCSPRR
jgi:hypothetical protein